VTVPTLRAMVADDAAEVLAIYQEGLDGGDAGFETVAPGWIGFDAARLQGHRFVAEDDTGVLGWVAATALSTRAVYSGVVEHSIYVADRARRRGVGRMLLDQLIVSTEQAGIWTIQSGIFPENQTSLNLHRRAGFRIVGIRERLGRHHGRWRDVVLLERRSPNVD
jgi:L-amino acid N-acyltransferase YncA